ncbi:MAG: hypothetical protein ABIH21_01070, partial [Patescibacteria group bacterium]
EDDFHGTEEYPTESKGFRTLRGILAEVYCNPFDLMIRKKGPKLLGGHSQMTKLEIATSVRVMQWEFDTTIKKPFFTPI